VKATKRAAKLSHKPSRKSVHRHGAVADFCTVARVALERGEVMS
jgi:hypothetical protein